MMCSRLRGHNDLYITNEMKEQVARVQMIEYAFLWIMTQRYSNLLVRWPVQDERISVSSSFLYGLYCFVPNGVKKLAFNNIFTNHQILQSLYSHYAKQSDLQRVESIKDGSVKTVVTCFFRNHYNTNGFLTETCIFCPLTVFQTQCLQALLRRWDFALAGLQSDRVRDIASNVFFELLRIYTHPFLAGCSESLVQESMKMDWVHSFRSTSSKVLVCDYMIQTYQSVFLACMSDVHSNTPPHSAFSRKPSACFNTSRSTSSSRMSQSNGTRFLVFLRSLFGVQTLQQLNQGFARFEERRNRGEFTVLLVGQLPMGVKMDLHSVRDVLVYDSDITPESDIQYLTQAFNMGVSSVMLRSCVHDKPLNVFRLVTPVSAEAEFFHENSLFIEQYQQITTQTNSFNQYIR